MVRTLEKFNFGDTSNATPNDTNALSRNTSGGNNFGKSQGSGSAWRRNTTASASAGPLGSLEDEDDGVAFN